MSNRLQIWAVDVSTYTLWTDNRKGEQILEELLEGGAEELSRIKRFVREIDQIRSFAGKLLVRLAVTSVRNDIKWRELKFQQTREGKPFLTFPVIDFDYNITHDGDWVAIAFRGSGENRGQHSIPCVGLDVMEIHLPHHEDSVSSFLDTMDMTLTPKERRWIESPCNSGSEETFATEQAPPKNLDREELVRLKKLYALWTYKEAFTKAKGMGLGIDFQTIEVKRNRSDVRILVSGQEEAGLSIVQITLPPGYGHIWRGKPGAGVGMESLLVAMQTESSSRDTFREAHMADEAGKAGLLRRLMMNDLVFLCRVACAKNRDDASYL